MRNITFYTLCMIGTCCQAQTHFITTWNTANTITINDNSITIPTTGGGYSYDVDWENDGIFDEIGITGSAFHVYGGKPGIKQIAIKGMFPRIYFNNGGDRLKLISIDQWGDNVWTSMNSAFEGCSNLTENASDAPNLSIVVSMSEMFRGATGFTGDINNWDVSNVPWMVSTFKDATSFNDDIGGWDMCSVNSIRFMFNGASSFNQDISGWDVSNITNFQSTFDDASAFDQNLGNWDVNQVTNMTNMLEDCGISRSHYDQTLIGWASQIGLQSGITLGANNLTYCHAINARDILSTGNSWTISGDAIECTNAAFITTWKTDHPGFSNDTSIVIPINPVYTYNYDVDWDNDGIYDQTGITGGVTHDFAAIGTYTIRIRGEFPQIYFVGSGEQKKIISIDQWGDMTWASMASSFDACSNLQYAALDNPDLSNVSDMSYMFKNCHSFNGAIGGWDVSNIQDMEGSFQNASSFNQDIEQWDISSVTNMLFMFEDASEFNQDISGWKVDSVLDLAVMFRDAQSFNQDISGWNVTSSTCLSGMFDGAIAFDQDLSSWDVSNALFLDAMLNNSAISMSHYDNILTSWASLSGLNNNINLGAEGLKYCEGASARQMLINTYNWNITDDGGGCPFITTWKTDNPGSSDNMSITIPTTGSGYNYDVDWTNDGIYDDIGVAGSLIHDYGAAGTYQVAIKGDFPRIIFNGGGDDDKIISIDQWGDISWSSFSRSFLGCDSLVYYATDSPILTNVTSMELAFSGADHFDGDLSSWDISTITNMIGMLNNSGISLSNYDNILIGWAAQTGLQNNVNLGASGLKYCDGTAARQSLIDNKNWTITDDFLSCVPFITTWKTDNPGSSDNTSITIPTTGSGYNYDVDWTNDGIYDDIGVAGSLIHDYGAAGTYQVAIRGGFPRIWFTNGGGDADKIVNIDQWGDIEWSTFSGAFLGCSNLEYSATDEPDLSDVISLNNAFRDANSFDGDLSCWDISTITSMTGMLDNTAISQSNYDKILIGWEAQSGLQNDVNLGASGLEYCDGATSRQSLIDNYNWNITGDAENCPIPFITTWKTDNPGSSNNSSITIPTSGTGYNYDIDWENDGIYDDLGVIGDMTHDYGTSGTYQVAIRREFPRIYMGGSGDDEKLISIDQWGEIEWSSMSSAFNGCSNMEYMTIDTPDLSNVTNMNNMFNSCTLFNGDISGWDVSNITSLRSTFNSASSFNQDIGSWDVSHVTDMESTFGSASLFNQDLSDWKVDSVTTMYEMFVEASSFNQNISLWNTGRVEDMDEMFRDATSFNQDISAWDLSGAGDLNSMFENATSFNQDLSDWDVSHLDDLRNLFSGATSFDQDLGAWDIRNVTDMTGMLDSTNLSQLNYDNTIRKWFALKLPILAVTLGANGLSYCTSSEERQALTDSFNWTIVGDQRNCSECFPPSINEWTGPATGYWHVASSWSQGTLPDGCDIVIIPTGKTVTIDESARNAICHNIEIAQGGSLITELPGTIDVDGGIPE